MKTVTPMKIVRVSECCGATNVGDECPEDECCGATNVGDECPEDECPEDECPEDECCGATNVRDECPEDECLRRRDIRKTIVTTGNM
jgi:hypothetical protein